MAPPPKLRAEEEIRFPPAMVSVKSVAELVRVAKVVPPSLRKTSAPSASRMISVEESRVMSPVELSDRVVVGVKVKEPVEVKSPPLRARSPVAVRLPSLPIVNTVASPPSPPGEIAKAKLAPFKTSTVGVALRNTTDAETDASPVTSSLAVGVVLPIPTLPVDVIRICSVESELV